MTTTDVRRHLRRKKHGGYGTVVHHTRNTHERSLHPSRVTVHAPRKQFVVYYPVGDGQRAAHFSTQEEAEDFSRHMNGEVRYAKGVEALPSQSRSERLSEESEYHTIGHETPAKKKWYKFW